MENNFYFYIPIIFNNVKFSRILLKNLENIFML